MAKIENNETKYTASPALIITGPRSGGTFLAHCLSSHPDIFFSRGEPLDPHSLWQELSREGSIILDFIWRMESYLVAGCKLLYPHIGYLGVWEAIIQRKPKIIHVVRHNRLRQAISLEISTGVRKGVYPYRAQHTFGTVDAEPIEINIESLLHLAKRLRLQEQGMQQAFAESKLDVMDLRYVDMTGPEGSEAAGLPTETAMYLCDFLNVPYAPMSCRLKKVNKGKLADSILNYSNICAIIQGTELEQWKDS